jgi:hypothetical protein
LFSVALVVVIVQTNWFSRKFGVTLSSGYPIDKNDPQLHMITYLQVAIISQALIFVTRSHSFFFMERPSVALMLAFCVAQLVSSIIAAYGDWGFTQIHSISGGWIGIVWVWVSAIIQFHHIGQALIFVLRQEHHMVYPSRLDQVRNASDHHQAPTPPTSLTSPRRQSRSTRAHVIEGGLYPRVVVLEPDEFPSPDDAQGWVSWEGVGEA